MGSYDEIEKLAFFNLIMAAQPSNYCCSFYNALDKSSKKTKSLSHLARDLKKVPDWVRMLLEYCQIVCYLKDHTIICSYFEVFLWMI